MTYDLKPSPQTSGGEAPSSESRRGFLKLAALTGAVVSTTGSSALATGDIGFFAKDLSDEKLIDMYRTILQIRWHERTQADQMLSNPDYRGYNHFYAGQEAVATGVCAALRNDGPFDQIDLVYSSHRPSGHAIAKGVDIPKMVAEMDFRATGMNGGYGAEMHISDPSVGFIGADGMIGPAPVIASGSAFAFSARGSDQVAVVFAGDGNYAAPHFHSTLNNTKLLDLPLIYVCENNLYHQYAHYSYSCPHKDIADAAGAYGVETEIVDGQDVIQVYNAAKEAVDRARAGPRPIVITTTGVPRVPRPVSWAHSGMTRWRLTRSGQNARSARGCNVTRSISRARSLLTGACSTTPAPPRSRKRSRPRSPRLSNGR